MRDVQRLWEEALSLAGQWERREPLGRANHSLSSLLFRTEMPNCWVWKEM